MYDLLFSTLHIIIILISHLHHMRIYVCDHSLGADASEGDVEVITEEPEDTVEPDQQQDQGKQLRILILARSILVNKRMIICYYIYYVVVA